MKIHWNIIDDRDGTLIAEVSSPDRLVAGAFCFMLSQEAKIYWGFYKIVPVGKD